VDDSDEPRDQEACSGSGSEVGKFESKEQFDDTTVRRHNRGKPIESGNENGIDGRNENGIDGRKSIECGKATMPTNGNNMEACGIECAGTL
jgi:hypothetical protein